MDELQITYYFIMILKYQQALKTTESMIYTRIKFKKYSATQFLKLSN